MRRAEEGGKTAEEGGDAAEARRSDRGFAGRSRALPKIPGNSPILPVVFRAPRKECAQRMSPGALRSRGIRRGMSRRRWTQFFCVRLSVFGNRAPGLRRRASPGLRREVSRVGSGLIGAGRRFRHQVPRVGTGLGVPASGAAFPEPERRSAGENRRRFSIARKQEGPPVREGLGAARAAVFPCANRGSGSFRERVEENQCIMEGSHKLSCGKATMSPTHTNRPTT